MTQKKSPSRSPSAAQQVLLDQVRLVLVTAPDERRRLQRLLQQHHSLGSLQAVGEHEQMCYAAVDAQGRWVALLLFSAAAKHLRHRSAGRAPNATAA